MLTFICYPKCSTCAKARAWLVEQGLEFTERDISRDNPAAEELRRWQATGGLPWKRFFNTSGMKYRELQLKDRLPELEEDEQVQLLASDGMLVKRPILLGEDVVLLGFKQADWEKALQ